MNKKLTMAAIAMAGLATQNANATISTQSVVAGTQIAIGCTVPNGANGSTVYSIDNQAINAALTAASVSGIDSIALASGVSIGAGCSYALSQTLAQQSITSTGTGRWVGVNSGAGSTVGTISTGLTPVNITVPGSGYSLQSYTFVAQ